MNRGELLAVPFPADFPNKGRYRTWDKQWNPTGFADDPQHLGQMPLTYPEDATPIECFMSFYLRARAATIGAEHE